MEFKPVKIEKDYQQALKSLVIIFDAKLNTKEGDELEILSKLVENNENKKYRNAAPDPIEAIKFRMEQKVFYIPLKNYFLAKKSPALHCEA